MAYICNYDDETHTYTMGGTKVPSVTQVLMDQGLVDTTWFTEAGRERGSAVHLAARYMDEHTLDIETVDEDLHGYLKAYKSFKTDTGFDMGEGSIEIPMWDKVHRFAGTPDRIGKLFGVDCIVDFKTGATLAPYTGLQLAGYELLTRHNHSPIQHIRRYALRLGREGKYKLTRYEDPTDMKVFVDMVGIYHWKKNNNI